MIGNTRPVGGAVKNITYLRKGELAEYPQLKYLFIRLGHGVQQLVYSHCCVGVNCLLLHTNGCTRLGGGGVLVGEGLGGGCALAFSQMHQIFVFRYLTQPHTNIAATSKAVRRPKSLEEGFGGELLGEVLVSGKGEEIAVNVPEIGVVNLFKIFKAAHTLASFRLLVVGRT